MEFIELDPNSAFEQAIETMHSDEKLVVCGSDECVEYLQEAMASSEVDEAKVLAKAQKIDALKWFANKEKQFKREFEEDEIDLAEVVGEWPEGEVEVHGFALANDILTGEPLNTVYGVRVTAKDSSEVLLKFKFGGWNDCPATEVHYALWKYWEEKYGARVVGVSNDVIEAYVENPPTNKEAAMTLAMEQYCYCYDIVDQGCESLSNLAATLMNAKTWYFWWD